MPDDSNSIAAVGGDINTLTWLVIVLFLSYAIIHTGGLEYAKQWLGKKK